MCAIFKLAHERFLKLMEWRLQGLLKMGIHGVIVSDVRGFGAQGGFPERQAGIFFCSMQLLSLDLLHSS